jgi:hypothetical protein
MASSSRSHLEYTQSDRTGPTWPRNALPAPRFAPGPVGSHVFVGRAEELARAARGLRDHGVAAIIGMAGVGKSALAERIASAWEGPTSRHHVRAAQTVAELLDDLRRSWADDGERSPELRSDGERLADALYRLDRARALAVVEDFDRLGSGAADLLAALSSLPRARVVVTSRTRLHTGSDPERVEILLGGLDAAEARELWARLDDLYGPRADFEEAWQRTGGNPLGLRRAHEADLDTDDDPVAATVAALDEDERRVAIALALVGQPLAGDVTARLLPARAAHAAIRGLTARLVVETTSCGELVVHGVIGDHLRAGADADELAAAHRALAGALEEAPLGLIDGTRLRVRHLAAAGLARGARDLLLSRAQELVRAGGAGELLRGLDLVAGEADTEARRARASAMAWMLDFEGAYGEVAALVHLADADAGLRIINARLALLTLRLDEAERVSRAGLKSAAVTPEMRVRFAAVYLLAATYKGDGRAARELIERGAAAFPAALTRGCVAFARAASFWLEERDSDAERAMRMPWPPGALGFRASLLAPILRVSALARAGKSSDAMGEAEDAAGGTDRLLAVSLRALRVVLLESQGEFQAARDEAAALEEELTGTGHMVGLLWIRLVRARLLLVCGQVSAGRRLLDDVTREAASAGAGLIVRLAARARQADPWSAVTSPSRSESARPGEARRDRVTALLRAMAAGQIAVARGYAAAIDRSAIDPLELALVALADRVLAADCDPAACHDADLTGVFEQAARAGADPELNPALAAWLRDRLAARSQAPTRLIVVDRHSETVRSDSAVVQLGRRPALRRLLYALLEAPGRPRDRSALARAIWGVEYRAAHDNALWINVKRLRVLLAPTGLRVASDGEGVRLRLEPGAELQVIAS